MKISTLKRKIQKIGSEIEALLQKIDNLIDEVEDDGCCEKLQDMNDNLGDVVETVIPEILDYIDEELTIEDIEEN
jgi:hypothetical protein